MSVVTQFHVFSKLWSTSVLGNSVRSTNVYKAGNHRYELCFVAIEPTKIEKPTKYAKVTWQYWKWKCFSSFWSIWRMYWFRNNKNSCPPSRPLDLPCSADHANSKRHATLHTHHLLNHSYKFLTKHTTVTTRFVCKVRRTETREKTSSIKERSGKAGLEHLLIWQIL